MKKLFTLILAAAALTAVSCDKTIDGSPDSPSIVGSWLVNDVTVTSDGDGAQEAETILKNLFSGFEGFTLVFNLDNSLILPEGTRAYSLVDNDLYFITMSDAVVRFEVNTLSETKLELTCNALVDIGGEIVFPTGVTELNLYILAERK